MAALLACLLIGATGCETLQKVTDGAKSAVSRMGAALKKSTKKSVASKRSKTSKRTVARKAGGKKRGKAFAASTRGTRTASAAKARSRAAAVAKGAVHVRLTQKGCMDFEPHWSTVRVGQSVIWHSRLKRSVTIHVPAGAFSRTAYVVRPGATVSSGPARKPGAYPMWTKPAACREVSRGVRGGAPGVSIKRRGA